MAEALNIEAQLRTQAGRRAKRVRQEGLIPAVIYGRGIEPRSLQVSEIPFMKVYREAGESTLVDLVVAGEEPIKVLIQDIQRHPLKDEVIHIDFRQVRMDEELETDIDLSFLGEAPAVRELGGNLVKSLDYVSVRCLPGALVSEISIDLSSLATFEDRIQIKDLEVPAGITILNDLGETVVFVEEPRSEEELKALEEAPVEAEVEGVKVEGEEEKKEEEAKEEEKPEEGESSKKS